MATISRRHFLGVSAATAGLGASGANAAVTEAETPAPSIQRYATLGRTGLTVSEIGFGSASSSDP
ncbi:MAG: twin-arginine translocation signal domain-containing protein, partial [Pseudomonadota bacterium]